MNKFNKIVLKYLEIGGVLAIGTLICSLAIYMITGKVPEGHFQNSFVQFLWDVAGIHLMFWVAVLLYFLFLLLISSKAREATLVKVARIKERDEREELIVGRASKSAFLATFALLIALFLLSGLEIDVSKLPEERRVDGKEHSISLGLRYSLTPSVVENNKSSMSIINYRGVPLSGSAIILFVLCWHIFSYHFFARRYSREC